MGRFACPHIFDVKNMQWTQYRTCSVPQNNQRLNIQWTVESSLMRIYENIWLYDGPMKTTIICYSVLIKCPDNIFIVLPKSPPRNMFLICCAPSYNERRYFNIWTGSRVVNWNLAAKTWIRTKGRTSEGLYEFEEKTFRDKRAHLAHATTWPKIQGSISDGDMR